MTKIGTLEYDIKMNVSQLNTATRQVEETNNRLAGSFRTLGVAANLYLGARLAKSFIEIADGAKLLDVRIRAVSSSQAEFIRNQQRLLEVAKDTGSRFGDIVRLFETLKLSSKELGASSSQVLQFVDTVSKLGVIGGSSPEDLKFALRQLNQSLASGIVRAEEFNSIVENTPAIARAIAAGMGKTNGELRLAVISGQVLSSEVIPAILSQTDEVNERMAKIPITVERASNALATSLGQAIKDINDNLKITQTLASGLMNASKVIDEEVKANRVIAELEAKRLAIKEGLLGADKDAFDEAQKLTAEMVKQQEIIIEMSAPAPAHFRGDTVRDDLARSNLKASAQMGLLQNQARLDEIAPPLSPAAMDARLQRQIYEIRNGGKYPTTPPTPVEAAGDPLKTIVVETPEAKAARKRAERAAAAAKKAAEEERKRREENLKDLIYSLSNETDRILQEYRDRNAEILELTKLGSQQQLDLLKSSELVKSQALREIETERSEMTLRASDEREAYEKAEHDAAAARYMDFAGNLLDVMVRSGKEQSAVAKALFLTMKAVQVAEIIAATNVAAAKASAVASIGGPFAWLSTQSGILASGYASAGMVAGLAVADTFTGGGRVRGGQVFAGAAHPINEDGNPEILQQGARQYLLPGSRGGNVVPLGDGGLMGGGSPSITIQNMGAPLAVISSSVSRDEIKLMVKNAEESAVKRVNTSLTQGRGPTANALRTGFKTERNIR